ncbi:MAG: phospholipase D family protein [Herminiimonas sp.]|nr:phospholipase D family protein [Herminiimonas sp.]
MTLLARRWCACACLLVFAPLVQAFDAGPPVVAAQGTVQAAFSPWDDVEALIVETLAEAKKEVLVQAYLLTNKKIANALIAAQHRSVSVRVLADADQARDVRSSKLADLAEAGIPVWLETKYQNAHNKLIIIDPAGKDATVITGSFNFTWSAQYKNAENILILRKQPVLAARYAVNWERHRLDAIPYKK